MVVRIQMTGQVDNLIPGGGLKPEDDAVSSDSRWSFSLPSSSLRSSAVTPMATGHTFLVSCTSVGSGGSSAVLST